MDWLWWISLIVTICAAFTWVRVAVLNADAQDTRDGGYVLVGFLHETDRDVALGYRGHPVGRFGAIVILVIAACLSTGAPFQRGGFSPKPPGIRKPSPPPAPPPHRGTSGRK